MADDWECGDCGWTVEAGRLPPGRTPQDAREIHVAKYCARPPTWPLG